MRALALVLTVVTGFTGLVYEVVWQRYLAILLGSHSEATAAILGIFLGGLAVGYALFGRVSRRLAAGGDARLLRAYAAVEAGIGIYAFAFPVLFALTRWVSLQVPHLSTGVGFALDLGLSCLLIGLPTVLMGGTIPFLSQVLARDLDDSVRIHALVYTSNTAGAFAGALAGGFVLVPQLGLATTVVAMGVLNVSAAAAFFALASRAPRATPAAGVPHAQVAAQTIRERMLPGIGLVVALAVGFAMMCVQTTLMRLGALSFGASPFTFATVVSVFVLCIALGSMAVALLRDVRPGHLLGALWGLVVLLLLLDPQLPNAPYWAHRVRILFGTSPADFAPFHLTVLAALLATLVLPIGLSGALLPLLFGVLRRRVGELGAVAGRLYAWNTVGSTLGALLGGYALLLWLDLHHVYRLSLACLAFAAALSAAVLLGGIRRAVGVAVPVLALVALTLLPAWPPERLSSGLFRAQWAHAWSGAGPEAAFRATQRHQAVRFYDDDPTASVAVRDLAAPGQPLKRAILVNGKSDGSVPGDYVTMALAGVLPALLARDCESAFVIGYGTGVTAGELAALDCTQRVEVAEISHAVIAAAPLFEEENRGALARKEVEVVRGDAYRSLMRGETRYDVIVSEPSNPWVTGVEMLYSTEFLAAARARLAPGGIYAQWFHTYESDTATIELVFRTFRSVFPEAGVWYATHADLILLGFTEPELALDLERIERRMHRPDLREALARVGIDEPIELLAHEFLPIGVLQAAQLPGGLHSLTRPRLTDRAARAFFGSDRTARLPRPLDAAARRLGAEHSLLRRFVLREGGLSDADRRLLLDETCTYRDDLCAALLAQWMARDPASAALRNTLAGAERTPSWKRILRNARALAPLYGADPEPDAAEAHRLASAHYHYAFPLAPGVLSSGSRSANGS